MTRQQEIAWSAGRDAGNRHMRKHGRKRWNRDDYNTAVDEYTRIMKTEPLAISRNAE